MRGRGWRAGWGLALALLGALAGGVLARGQPAGVAGASFVVLVDMEDRDLPTLPATVATIQNFIRTGFNRRIAEGGGYTVMPFGRQVVTDRALRMNWSSARREGDAQMVEIYLRGVAGQARTRLDAAVAAAVEQAPAGPLTLIIFTSRSEFDAGTPHDGAIQEIFDEHRFRQRRARKPMLASLNHNGGRWGDWTVFHGDGVIELPAWEPEPGAAAPAATPPASPATISAAPKVSEVPAASPAQAAPPLAGAAAEPLVGPTLPEPNKLKLERPQAFAAPRPAAASEPPAAAAKPEPAPPPAAAAESPAPAPVVSLPPPGLTNVAADGVPPISSPIPPATPASPAAGAAEAPPAAAAAERPADSAEPPREIGPAVVLPASPPPPAATPAAAGSAAGGWLLGLAGLGFGILGVWWVVNSRSRGRRTTLISQLMDSSGK